MNKLKKIVSLVMKYLIGIPLSIIFLITFLQKIDNAAI